MPRSIHCFLLTILILPIAGCAKHKLSPFPTVQAPPPEPQPTTDTPTVSEQANEAGRPHPARPKSAAASAAPQQATPKIPQIDQYFPGGFATMNVPLPGPAPSPESLQKVREILQDLAVNQLLFICPTHMPVDNWVDVRLTTKASLNEAFKSKLRLRGWEPSEIAQSTLRVQAELDAPDKSAFRVETLNAPERDSFVRHWRVQPRATGKRVLELTVLLNAELPALGDVQSAPIVYTQDVSVESGTAGLFRYLRVIGAGLAVCVFFTWIVWLIWRRALIAIT